MSTVTARSVRRAGNQKWEPGAPSLYSILAKFQELGIPYSISGSRLRGARVAHTVAHFTGNRKVITGIHPTKRATRGRMTSITFNAA